MVGDSEPVGRLQGLAVPTVPCCFACMPRMPLMHLLPPLPPTQAQVFRYTNEEYEQLLRSDSNGWSREETDQLMELCDRFDLRFPVMADRFEVSNLVLWLGWVGRGRRGEGDK